MRNTMRHIVKRIKEGLLDEIWTGTKWVYQYARHYWRAMFIYTLIGFLMTAISLVSSLISKDLVDIITGHQTGQLVKTFCIFIGFSIANIVISQISNYISTQISIKVDNEIKSDIFDKILITDWEPLTSYHTGDLLTRWNSDASTISSGILNWVPNFFINIVRFISTFAVVMYYDPTFALFALIGIPFSALMSKSLIGRMQDNNKQSAAMSAKLSGFNQETFSNIQTIKAFDLITIYSNRLKQLQKESFQIKMKFQKLTVTTSILMSLVGIIVSNTCYGWGIYRVWSGAISYGTMTMFLSLSGTLTGTLNSLLSMIPNAIYISTSASRLRDILDMPKEDYSDIDKIDEQYQNIRESGTSIHIQGMDYSYRNGTIVFSDTSFEAHPHEIIALVGPSGEGKTTLLRILLALLRPQQGQYLISSDALPNSIPISPATRKLFSYVPQGNTMFSGTIAENMRNVKPDATDDEIILSLRMACAWEFVEKLPDGINSKIGERGGGFSEGQSQRLSIARALLRKTPILLLDEATSALDVSTERKVLRNLMQDEYPRTCIITTHKPTALSICHKVYRINHHRCHILTKQELTELVQTF